MDNGIELSGHYGYRRIVRTMAPMALMMVVISVYSIVDGFFISNYAGPDAFAGMNLIWPAVALVGALGTMMGSGGSALVSKTFGEGDPGKANRIFSMLVRVTFLTGAILGLGLFFLMPAVSRVLGADEAMLPHAVLYGRYMVAVLPFFMLQMFFQPYFMVAERPGWGMRMSLLCGVINMVFDALFVAVFGWGLMGAALATSLSLITGGVVPALIFASKRNSTQLKFVRCSVDLKALAKSCSNGLSEFVGNIAFNIIGICYNLQLMRYIGADGVSAYGILMYLGFTFGAVFMGYNMGITQVIAYNYGAGNREEMRSLLRKSMVIIAVSGALMTLVSQLSAPLISRFFVGYDESLCALTEHALRIYMISLLLCGFNMFASAWFTALNNGVISAVAAFARTLVFELGSIFILPGLIGIDGIWFSVNVAEALAFVLSISLIAAFARRYGYRRRDCKTAQNV